MKNEEINKKLEKLSMLYQQLKAIRHNQEEDFSLANEDLLSKPELLEETLKNYMYQFGLSLYRNKKGNRFFKKFINSKRIRAIYPEDEDDDGYEIRGFDELEPQCFEFEEGRPSLLQRLLEYRPADRLHMLNTIEDTVDIISSKDPQMLEIFNELVNEEINHCMSAIYDGNLDTEIAQTFNITNEITTPEIKVDINTPDINVRDVMETIKATPSKTTTKRKRTATTKSTPSARNYNCGTSNAKGSKNTSVKNNSAPTKVKTKNGNINDR